MNETQWDNIFEILEKSYYEAIDFCDENCVDTDDDTWEKLFHDKIRGGLLEVKKIMTESAWVEGTK